jgi:hypothetical protein
MKSERPPAAMACTCSPARCCECVHRLLWHVARRILCTAWLDAVRCALPCNDVCCTPHAAHTPCCCTGTFCMLHVHTVRSISHAACCALRRRPLRRLSRPAAAATGAVVCSRHEKRVRACALPCGVGWTGTPCCRPTSSVRAAKHMRTHAACACAAAAEAEGVTEQGRTRHVYSPVIRATDLGCTEGPNDTGES